ncbi:MAG TPA: OmpA family protein [Saprospiraceae bacterium]|nr:OmpA family protein [Saprospiraceae bacterium]
MFHKISTLLLFTMVLVQASAQVDSLATGSDTETTIMLDAGTPTSEPAVDASLNTVEDKDAMWKSGKAKYPAKPKNMWEIGVHGGHYFIDGDVDPYIKPGFGVGLHIRKAIHYVFSIRGDVAYQFGYGLDPQPSSDNLENEPEVFAGYGVNNPWFFNYKTTYCYGVVEGVLNIGNILFHKDRNKWNWYLFLGTGLDGNITKHDLRDKNGRIYTNLLSAVDGLDFNTRQGRLDIKNKLKSIYDGTYETDAYQKKGIFRFNDEVNVHVVFIGGMGIARKITNRFNIGLEHQVQVTDNDYLDGQKYRTRLDQTNQDDIQHYTNLRLALNLGSFKKKVEPLYWVNPLDPIYSDIAELKQRPVFDLSDKDQDGVIDMLDQEQETPAGAPVDTRGITLDSDNDGMADYKDEEPYSPPGYQVNDKGIAQVPVAPKITEDDVKRIVDQKVGTMYPNQGNYNNTQGQNGTVINNGSTSPSNGNSGGSQVVYQNGGGLMDWFLPMIHFNLDEYCIKSQYQGQLHNVAQVMLSHPELTVTAYGHTDVRNTNSYNQVLSYNRAKAAIDYLVTKYGIARERFKLMYGGEETPLGSSNYMNRRVEFRVSKAEDTDMGRPEGPDAGDCHKKRMRKSGSVKTDNGTADDKKSGY